jgi:small subunit ribosomal protein S20
VPNLPSAKKRMRQNAKQRTANRHRKSSVKTEVKKLIKAVAGGDSAAAEQQLRATTKVLDQTAAKGAIHRNAAARKKSRLAKKLAALESTAGA